MKNYSNFLAFFSKIQKKAKRFCNSKAVRNISTENSRNGWKSVIGLEIHAQLSTKSKLFSFSPSVYGAPTNSAVSLFDAAIPGTLPVLNKTAVELAVLSALALGCDVNAISYFDRKHYFYPDLPAGYQITQQRFPLAQNGAVEYAVYQPGVHSKPYYRVSKIKQIQLEQDSGKSLLDVAEGQNYIDLNRAGVALIEIVFEPDVEDEEEATALIKEVIKILERAQSCSCKLEEGAFRIDVNVSVHKEGTNLGTRTEIKNVGSVHGVNHAIKEEIKRQLSIVQNGGVVKNETLTWDASNNKLIILRDKEDSQDYRFIPEPNLPPLRLLIDDSSKLLHQNVKSKHAIFDLQHLKEKIPVAPQKERVYLIEKYGLSDAYAYNLVNLEKLFYYFKDILLEDESRNTKTTYLLLMHQFLKGLKSKNMELKTCSVSARHLGEIVDLLDKRRISKLTVDFLIMELLNPANSLTPKELVEKNNLEIISNPKELRKLCQRVVDRETGLLGAYKKRKKVILKDLISKAIEETNYRADTQVLPSIMAEVINEKLERES